MTTLYTLSNNSKLVIKYNATPRRCSVCGLQIPKFYKHLVQGYYYNHGWYRERDRNHFCGNCSELNKVLKYLGLSINEKHFTGIGINEVRGQKVTGVLDITEGAL